MKPSPQLRTKIDELVALDTQRRGVDAKEYPDGITYSPSHFNPDQLVDKILSGKPSPVLVALEKLSDEELIYVMALAWYGRGDGIAEEGATFESVLAYARKQFDKNTAFYVYEKPLSVYLPRGLERIGA